MQSLSLFQNEVSLDPFITPGSLKEVPQEKGNKIVFSNPSTTEVKEKWELLKKDLHDKGIYADKYTLTFSQPVDIRVNRRKVITKRKISVKLFLSPGKDLCYTFNKRTGYLFGYPDAFYLTSLEAILPEVAISQTAEKVKKLANRIHPNAWQDIKKQIIADPEKYAGNYGATVTSISSKFPEYVINQLREAFENKSDYSHRIETYHHSGRNLTVQTKMGEDGIFRAWFSSEYYGCANGDYWILANPTTAIFKETD